MSLRSLIERHTLVELRQPDYKVTVLIGVFGIAPSMLHGHDCQPIYLQSVTVVSTTPSVTSSEVP